MIPVKVRVFAVLKEKLGTDELEVELEKGSCDEVLKRLELDFVEATSILQQSLVAVNGERASRETSLSAGDEVAILPPVSGG